MVKKSDVISPEPHPLFPPKEEGEEAPEVAYINITKFIDGRQKWHRRMFAAGDIRSLDDVAELFGGGHYELVARGASIKGDGSPGWPTGHRRYDISGPSKPFGEDSEQKTNGTPAPAVTVAPSTPQGPDTSIMGMFMQMQIQMMQMQAQATERADQARREDAARSKTEQADMMKMIATLNASSQQSFVQMMTAVMTMQRQGGGTEDLGKILELLKGLGFKPPGAEDAEGAGSNMLADAADLAMALPAALGSLKGMVPPIPAGPVPPGSAGSVFKKPGEP